MRLSTVSEHAADSCSPLARGFTRRSRCGLSRVAWLPAALAVASLVFSGCGSSEETSDAGADAEADSDAEASSCEPLGPGMPCREDIEPPEGTCYGMSQVVGSEDPRYEFRCTYACDGSVDVCYGDEGAWACDGESWYRVSGVWEDWELHVDGPCDWNPIGHHVSFHGELVYDPRNVPSERIVPPVGQCYLRAFPLGDPRNEYLCECPTVGALCVQRYTYECASTVVGRYWKAVLPPVSDASATRDLDACEFEMCSSCDYRNHPLGD